MDLCVMQVPCVSDRAMLCCKLRRAAAKRTIPLLDLRGLRCSADEAQKVRETSAALAELDALRRAHAAAQDEHIRFRCAFSIPP